VVAGRRVEGSTKGGKSRVVSLDAGTVAVLREHRARQLAERLRMGSLWVETDYVFVNEIGEPVHADTPSHVMPKLVRRAGVPPARLHDLRHMHATTLLLAGVPVHVVSDRLGHADPAITLRVYAHVIRDHTAEVGELFAAAVGDSC